jgi:putative oxygen-independent coproporphyrinogen III oxidase
VRLFDPVADLEITLEANPTSIEAGRLAEYRAVGVNRVSIGIQSLDENALRSLGREHSVTEAIGALALARRLFPRVSFDLIYARPGQDLSGWRKELRTALEIAADHLSLYQLTIEPATQFEALFRQGKIVLPDEDTAAALYDLTGEECARAGLQAYEISNYARPGEESRHNLAYWRYLDYAGIGPGAHGRVTIGDSLHATRRHRAPEVWADRVERAGDGLTLDEPIPSEERAREALLMGLRLAEGIDLGRFAARTGRPVAESVDSGVMSQCIAEGYLIETPKRLLATREGRIRLDSLLAGLVL